MKLVLLFKSTFIASVMISQVSCGKKTSTKSSTHVNTTSFLTQHASTIPANDLQEAAPDTNTEKAFVHEPIWNKQISEDLVRFGKINPKKIEDLPELSKIISLIKLPNYTLNKSSNYIQHKIPQAQKTTLVKFKKRENLELLYKQLGQKNYCPRPRPKISAVTPQESTPWCYAFAVGRSFNELFTGQPPISYYYLTSVDTVREENNSSLNINFIDGGSMIRTLVGLQSHKKYVPESVLPFDGALVREFSNTLDQVWNNTSPLSSNYRIQGKHYSLDIDTIKLDSLRKELKDYSKFLDASSKLYSIPLSTLNNNFQAHSISLPHFGIQYWNLETPRDQSNHQNQLALYFSEIADLLSKGHRIILNECSSNLKPYVNPNSSLTLTPGECEEHAITIYGLHWDEEKEKCMTTMENSWGPHIGKDGIVEISLEDFLKQWRRPTDIAERYKVHRYSFSVIRKDLSHNEFLYIEKNGDIRSHYGEYKHNGLRIYPDGLGSEVSIISSQEIPIKATYGTFQKGQLISGIESKYESIENIIEENSPHHQTAIQEKVLQFELNHEAKVLNQNISKSSGDYENLKIKYNSSLNIESLTYGVHNEKDEFVSGVRMFFYENESLRTYEEGFYLNHSLVEGIRINYSLAQKVTDLKMLGREISGNEYTELNIYYDEASRIKSDSIILYRNTIPWMGYRRSYKEARLTGLSTTFASIVTNHKIEVPVIIDEEQKNKSFNESFEEFRIDAKKTYESLIELWNKHVLDK